MMIIKINTVERAMTDDCRILNTKVYVTDAIEKAIAMHIPDPAEGAQFVVEVLVKHEERID